MHEELKQTHVIEGSSDRSFGLTVGGIFVAIEAYRFWGMQDLDAIAYVLLGTGLPLIFFGAIYPAILAPFNKAWMQLGLLMFRIVNPVVMLLMYITTIVPIGLIMRMMRKDLLRLKLEPDAKSYWIERDPAGPAPETMKNQF